MQNHKYALLSNCGISSRTIDLLCANQGESEILAFLISWQPRCRDLNRESNASETDEASKSSRPESDMDQAESTIAPVPLTGTQLKAALEIDRYFHSKEWYEEQKRLGII